jgi:hypothetical protein
MYSVPVDLDPRSISTSIVYCRFGPPGPNLLVDMDPGVPFAGLDPLQKLNICNVNQGSPNFIAAIAAEGEQNAVDHCGNDGNFLPYIVQFLYYSLCITILILEFRC